VRARETGFYDGFQEQGLKNTDGTEPLGDVWTSGVTQFIKHDCALCS
jgi:hypothetical protein